MKPAELTRLFLRFARAGRRGPRTLSVRLPLDFPKVLVAARRRSTSCKSDCNRGWRRSRILGRGGHFLFSDCGRRPSGASFWGPFLVIRSARRLPRCCFLPFRNRGDRAASSRRHRGDRWLGRAVPRSSARTAHDAVGCAPAVGTACRDRRLGLGLSDTTTVVTAANRAAIANAITQIRRVQTLTVM